MSQKKQHHFLTFFIPGPKYKMATNGKIKMNPSGSSVGEQLVAKRLTLENTLKKQSLRFVDFDLFGFGMVSFSNLNI